MAEKAAIKEKGYVQLRAMLKCGVCGGFTEYLHFPPDVKSIRKMHESLQKDGWKFTEDRGWVCPSCNYREQREMAEKNGNGGIPRQFLKF